MPNILDVTSYRVVSVQRELVAEPKLHAHVVSVGTSVDDGVIDRWWTLAETLAAMEGGEHFYTIGSESKMLARVRPSVCPLCLHDLIGSTGEAVADNNLESLPSV